MDINKILQEENQPSGNKNNSDNGSKKPMSKKEKIINIIGWIIIILIVVKGCSFMFSDDDKTTDTEASTVETQKETDNNMDKEETESEQEPQNASGKYGISGVSAQAVMENLEETYAMSIDDDPTNPSISHSGIKTTDYWSGNDDGLGYEIDIERGTDSIVLVKVSMKSENYSYFEDVIKLIAPSEANSEQIIAWLNENKEKVDPEEYSYSANRSSGGIDYKYEVRNFTDSQLITLEMWSTPYHEKVRASS